MGIPQLQAVRQPLAVAVSRRRFIAIPTALVAILFWIWIMRLAEPDPFSLGSSSPSSAALTGPPKPPRVDAENAVYPRPPVDLSDAAAPFVGWPLRRVCNEAQWIEGLVFVCDNNSGGIGNIRNYIQTCIRYALEAGATGLVVPRIRKRSETDLADLFTDYLPFNYMFDERHFRDAFNTNCPQITIFNNLTVIPGFVGESQIEEIRPKAMVNRNIDWQDQNRHTDHWGHIFRQWLYQGYRIEDTAEDATPQESVHTSRPPTPGSPRIIRFQWGVLWDWPVFRDGSEFAATFGNILKFHPELLRLGNQALQSMHHLAHTHGDEDGHFLGVHLRSESDAMDFWPSYEDQAKVYVDAGSKRGLKTAYLATGNATEAKKFETLADATMGMKVVYKTELLDARDLEMLDTLTWDQQALVDLVVLLGSHYFVGVMPSSFSVFVTMKRHLQLEGLYTRPYKTGTEGDGRSYLVGRWDEYYNGWEFMFDGMWP